MGLGHFVVGLGSFLESCEPLHLPTSSSPGLDAWPRPAVWRGYPEEALGMHDVTGGWPRGTPRPPLHVGDRPAAVSLSAPEPLAPRPQGPLPCLWDLGVRVPVYVKGDEFLPVPPAHLHFRALWVEA